MEFDTVDKILDFAIQKEQDASDFYTSLAEMMEYKHMKEVFLGFAAEERGHKVKLIAVKNGKQMVASEQKVKDLKIGEHLVDIELKKDLGFQEALIVAMKAEKAAFKLYTDLASATSDASLKEILIGLAQEEAKHKLRFEIEYDDSILKEN
ncbi:MAG: ferritin family protein [candidate division Zixibacteria bacterium]|nr:ferritin family protein [candidate division Zixibacteria bacterium]